MVTKELPQPNTIPHIVFGRGQTTASVASGKEVDKTDICSVIFIHEVCPGKITGKKLKNSKDVCDPFLALIFENKQSIEIFEYWLKRAKEKFDKKRLDLAEATIQN